MSAIRKFVSKEQRKTDIFNATVQALPDDILGIVKGFVGEEYKLRPIWQGAKKIAKKFIKMESRLRELIFAKEDKDKKGKFRSPMEGEVPRFDKAMRYMKRNQQEIEKFLTEKGFLTAKMDYTCKEWHSTKLVFKETAKNFTIYAEWGSCSKRVMFPKYAAQRYYEALTKMMISYYWAEKDNCYQRLQLSKVGGKDAWEALSKEQKNEYTFEFQWSLYTQKQTYDPTKWEELHPNYNFTDGKKIHSTQLDSVRLSWYSRKR
jgi:hypothetical protein